MTVKCRVGRRLDWQVGAWAAVRCGVPFRRIGPERRVGSGIDTIVGNEVGKVGIGVDTVVGGGVGVVVGSGIGPVVGSGVGTAVGSGIGTLVGGNTTVVSSGIGTVMAAEPFNSCCHRG